MVSAYPGGNGAVREFAEFILISQGKSITLPERW
jgi:3-deoxy-D-manno-octulosonate 8-phosphate phosphatase KdsC-like HAD superfamily phosphatase